MKKSLVVLVLILALVVAAGAYLGAQRPARSTVMGEVIDLASFIIKGARGEEHAEAGRFRAENGFPLAIMTEEGEVYLAVFRKAAPASPLETANRRLGELVGMEVVAQGFLYERDGLKLIEISVVSEM